MIYDHLLIIFLILEEAKQTVGSARGLGEGVQRWGGGEMPHPTPTP